MNLKERTIYDIIFPCIATILTCTYIAIHLDVPRAKERWCRTFLRKLTIGLYLLLVPEFVIFWVFRQYEAAARVCATYQHLGWNHGHGFLLVMGGFALYDRKTEEYIETLTFDRFEALLAGGCIEWPLHVDAHRVADLGKADYFSKGVVVVQTTWFVTQCIVRGTQLLPLTELEVVTLGVAVLNAFVYGLWWHKPMDVRYPVAIYCDRRQIPAAQPANHTATLFENRRRFQRMPIIGRFTAFIDMLSLDQCDPTLGKIPAFYVPSIPPTPSNLNHQPTRQASTSIKPIAISITVFLIFSVIHFIPWLSGFPSATQMYMWRISSITVIAMPLFLILTHIGFDAFRPDYAQGAKGTLPMLVVFLIGMAFYVYSRAMIVVLPIVQLFSLSAGGQCFFVEGGKMGQAVDWISYMPHIG